MKKFIFRLETLLKMRSVRESALKRDLEHAHQKWNQVKEREKMLQAQIIALSDDMKKKREDGQLALQETYLQILGHLQTSLTQTQHNLWGQQSQVEEYKKRLQQALQERKIIEKIKEKHYASWHSQESQIEEAMLDELACQRSADSH
jgi:flagellar FliJ protein